MNHVAIPVCLLLLFSCFAQAQPPATPVVNITGTIGQQDDLGVAALLGHNGVLFFRTQARWQEFQDRLTAKMPLNAQLPKIDFTKQHVVLVYADDRRHADAFFLAKSDLAATPPRLDFVLHWDNRGEEQRESRYVKFILALVPSTPTVQVTLASQPINVDRSRLVTEFSATLGDQTSGDIVDGLQPTITS